MKQWLNRKVVFLILAIQREEEKIKRSLKEAAGKNDKQVCTILAKEIIRSRKAISKIYTSKAHLNSVQMQMKNQLGNVKLQSNILILKGHVSPINPSA